MNNSQRPRYSGFTLVELLIVIVVIGVLAAIVTVAYRSVAAHARDSSRDAALSQFRSAIEAYHASNGNYPDPSQGGVPCHPGSGTQCTVSDSTLGSFLVPGVVSTLPNDPDKGTSKAILYVTSAGGTAYGLLMLGYETKPAMCRYLGPGAPASWWSNAPAC